MVAEAVVVVVGLRLFRRWMLWLPNSVSLKLGWLCRKKEVLVMMAMAMAMVMVVGY